MNSGQDGGERKHAWFDSLVRLLILAVAVFGIIQNRIVWVLVLVLLLVLQNYALLQRQTTKIRLKRMQRQALTKYTVRFQGLVKEGYQFVCGQNELSIPNRVRQIATKEGVQIREYNSHIENLFYGIVADIQSRSDNDLETFEDLKKVSSEFSRVMNSFALIYVDDFSGSLKRAEGFTLINEWELADLRKCYESFHNFVDRHNAFRIELATDLRQNGADCLIKVPTQIL